MDTNTVNTVVMVGEDVITTVKNLSAEAFTIVVCIAIGYALQWIPSLNNKWIPFLIMFIGGPIAYYACSYVSWDDFLSMNFPIVKQGFMGLILGVVSWIIHNRFLKNSWIEKWITPKEEPAKL